MYLRQVYIILCWCTFLTVKHFLILPHKHVFCLFVLCTFQSINQRLNPTIDDSDTLQISWLYIYRTIAQKSAETANQIVSNFSINFWRKVLVSIASLHRNFQSIILYEVLLSVIHSLYTLVMLETKETWEICYPNVALIVFFQTYSGEIRKHYSKIGQTFSQCFVFRINIRTRLL